MDAQEQIALAIVAATALAFGWRWWRARRRSGLPCGSDCGCGTASGAAPESSVLQARKGERARLVVRAERPQR